MKKKSRSEGLEPPGEFPTAFQVQLLNHSDTTANNVYRF